MKEKREKEGYFVPQNKRDKVIKVILNSIQVINIEIN
jgi:hypothetical protein